MYQVGRGLLAIYVYDAQHNLVAEYFACRSEEDGWIGYHISCGVRYGFSVGPFASRLDVKAHIFERYKITEEQWEQGIGL